MQKTASSMKARQICWMKDVFLQMSVFLAWQKGADQKIYAGDSNVAPEALEIKKATCRWHNVKCASGKSSCKICPIWNR